MLENLIILVVVALATCLIVKMESRNLRSWIYRDRTEMKEALLSSYNFWLEFFSYKKWLRILCIVAILILQRNWLSMMISIALFLGMSYYFAKFGYLDKIDWSNEKTQKMVNAITISFVILRVLSKIGLLGIIFKVMIAVTFLIVVITVVYLLTTKDSN